MNFQLTQESMFKWLHQPSIWGNTQNLQGAPVRGTSKEGQGANTSGLPKPNESHFVVLTQSEPPTASMHESVCSPVANDQVPSVCLHLITAWASMCMLRKRPYGACNCSKVNTNGRVQWIGRGDLLSTVHHARLWAPTYAAGDAQNTHNLGEHT